MREIKFRAWDNDHKQWRYGWLTKLVEGVRRFTAIICDNEDGDLTRYYIHEDKTVGQYTGLKDKNGKEIYEGDIVAGGKTIRTVIFKDGQYIPTNGHCTLAYLVLHGWVVIGNIHENPELVVM